MSIAHGLSRFWTCVATKPTSGEAAAYALKHVTPHDLARPPDVGSKLPRRARMNVDAALRVLEIGPYAVHVEVWNTSSTRDVSEAKNSPATASMPLETMTDEKADKRTTPPTRHELDATVQVHVSTLRRWAASIENSDAPETTLREICSVPEAAGPLLTGATPEATAKLVRVLAKHGSGLFVSALCQGPLRAVLRTLQAAAKRELIEALEELAESHPRAAVTVFYAPCAAPASEVFSRMVVRLPPSVAADALRSLCAATQWADQDARLVESCVQRCAEEGIIDVLATAIEQHAGALQKSLHFGRVLIAAVTKVPEFKTRYADVVRTAAAQSKVFLARRALRLLPQMEK